jgi:hypothetical protein
LVPIRDSLEDQAAQERGTLLPQLTDLLMKRMRGDPYLFISPAVLTTVQSVPTELNNIGSIVPNNAHGLGNPKPSTSLIDPSEEGTSQPETSQVSMETQAPNPLGTLIHIYSDEKNLKPTHTTPMRVQEEKGPEKTASPKPKVQDKKVFQKEIGSEGGLDIRESDKQEAEVGPSDESPQKEINSSTTDEQVSNESVPDAPIVSNIQIPDE